MSSTAVMKDFIYAEPLIDTPLFAAGLSIHPTTPGQHVLILKHDNLFTLPTNEFEEVTRFVRGYTKIIKEVSGVLRCGLAYDGFKSIHIIPMHGLTESWEPIRAEETPMAEVYPGFLWTKSSARLTEEQLQAVQKPLIASSGWQESDNTFHGQADDSNLFAKLVRGEIPQWRIWEDGSHVAFLTPFANTPGFSVLIPRKHLSSDILSLPSHDYVDLVRAVREVSGFIMSGLRTSKVGLFFEGFEIDYAHAKLVPVLSGSADVEGPSEEFHETYPGYITTRLGPRRGADFLDQTYRDLQKLISSHSFNR